ncbi:hypothetical protein RXR22_23960 [Raoultella ornithinolytica]|uniref:hypothetical protein n=1 Tax=Raoultella ornithinolytica TaxID=54291 RepID=UPI0028FF5FD3|nr:hypothetical protein [Raoultella ornithinolytica]MDU0923283.1 hypothetical protein [Raoultella ornithinolytica]
MFSSKAKTILYISVFILSTIATTIEGSAQAAIGGAVTIGAFLDGLRGVVQQLETSSSALISQGNNSLAQQQLILAGTLQATIQQVATAYSGSLDKTFAQIDTTEFNTFKNVSDLADKMTNLENKSSTDIQDLVYKTQGASNQLLDRIPLIEKTPVFYGISVRDMVSDPEPNPSDIQILGFDLSDSQLNFKKPVVQIAGHSLDDKFVSVQQDRIQVQIPDDIKAKIGFGSGACNPRMTFTVDVQVFYGIRRFFGLWTSEHTTTFHSNALAGAQVYTAMVTYSGSRTDVTDISQTFTTSSGSVEVGCEKSGSTSVQYQLPTNATTINCTAAWINTSKLNGVSPTACIVTGTTASASGTIRGLDKDCLPGSSLFGGYTCNCPGGGHGTLMISGTYKTPNTNVTSLTDVTVGKYNISNRGVSLSLPSDAAVTKKAISISITRKNCPAVFDKVALALPTNPLQIATQTSSEGHFEATYQLDQVTISQKP